MVRQSAASAQAVYQFRAALDSDDYIGVDESFLMILWPGVTSSSQFSSIVETISELQCNMNYNQIVHV